MNKKSGEYSFEYSFSEIEAMLGKDLMPFYKPPGSNEKRIPLSGMVGDGLTKGKASDLLAAVIGDR